MNFVESEILVVSQFTLNFVIPYHRYSKDRLKIKCNSEDLIYDFLPLKKA